MSPSDSSTMCTTPIRPRIADRRRYSRGKPAATPRSSARRTWVAKPHPNRNENRVKNLACARANTPAATSRSSGGPSYPKPPKLPGALNYMMLTNRIPHSANPRSTSTTSIRSASPTGPNAPERSFTVVASPNSKGFDQLLIVGVGPYPEPKTIILACLVSDVTRQSPKACDEIVGQVRLHTSSKPISLPRPALRSARAF